MCVLLPFPRFKNALPGMLTPVRSLRNFAALDGTWVISNRHYADIYTPLPSASVPIIKCLRDGVRLFSALFVVPDAPPFTTANTC